MKYCVIESGCPQGYVKLRDTPCFKARIDIAPMFINSIQVCADDILNDPNWSSRVAEPRTKAAVNLGMQVSMGM